jgi:hypothetical protein
MKKDTNITMEQVLRSPYLKDGDEELFLKVRLDSSIVVKVEHVSKTRFGIAD